MNDSARANILQQIRANLEEVSFGASATAGNNIVTTLSNQTNYYSSDGLPLVATGSSIPAGAYYQATFAATSATYPNSTTQFQYESAQNVQVILTYPTFAPASSQTQMTNYIFAAKQKNY